MAYILMFVSMTLTLTLTLNTFEMFALLVCSLFRFQAEGYTIERYPIKIGAYLTFEHETQIKNMKR